MAKGECGLCLDSASWVPGAAADHDKAAVNGHRAYFQDLDVWKRAPLLKGATQFEPRPDVKNIMVTGGAGFM